MFPLPFPIPDWLARVALYGFLAAIALGATFLFGYAKGEQKFHDLVAKQAVERVAIVVRQGKVTEKIITRYVKVVTEAEPVIHTIKETVTRYVQANPTSVCIDPEWRMLHDASATRTIPRTPGPTDDERRAPPTDPGRTALGWAGASDDHR